MTEQVEGTEGGTTGAVVNGAPDETALRQKFGIPDDLSPEQYARAQGWRPEHEYRGPADKWRPLDQFLEFGVQNHTVLTERYKTLAEKNARLERELTETRKDATEFKEFMTGTKKAIAERQRENLVDAKVSALEAGDHRRVVEIDEQLRRMDTAAPVTPPPAQTQTQDIPQVAQWKQSNAWYGQDLAMTADADAVAGQVLGAAKAAGRTPEPSEMLKAVDDVLKRRWPDKFQIKQETTNTQSTVDTRGGTAGGASFTTTNANGSGRQPIYANLPPEAKAQADKFIARGFYKINTKDPKAVEAARNIYAQKFFEDFPNGRIPE